MSRYVERMEMLRAAGAVQRLHTLPLIDGYSIASHVYNAQCIAMSLCHQNLIEPGGVLTVLLVHDAAEVELGDLPAPLKRSSATIADAYSALEKDFERRWGLQQIECWVRRAKKIPGGGLNELELGIVKAADYLELAWRCLVERRRGNADPRLNNVFVNAISYLTEHQWITGVGEVTEYLKMSWRRYEHEG